MKESLMLRSPSLSTQLLLLLFLFFPVSPLRSFSVFLCVTHFSHVHVVSSEGREEEERKSVTDVGGSLQINPTMHCKPNSVYITHCITYIHPVPKPPLSYSGGEITRLPVSSGFKRSQGGELGENVTADKLLG